MTQKKTKPLPPAVMAITQMRLTGNIIPRNWYKVITMPNGKPDMNAITILAELCFRYRAMEVIDNKTGRLIGYRKSFDGDMFQCGAPYWAEKFGMSQDQCLDAAKRLEAVGLIKRVVRNKVKINGRMFNNVVYMEPVPERVREVSYPADSQVEIYTMSDISDTLSDISDALSVLSDALSDGSVTLSDISDALSVLSETNTKKTHIALKDTTTTTPDGGSSGSDLNEKTPGAILRQDRSTEGLDLDFGNIRAQEQPALLKILEDLGDKAQAQDIIDELIDNIMAGTVKKSKPALLRALVNRANAGKFTLTSERGTARAQRKVIEEAQKQAVKPVQEKKAPKELSDETKLAREAARRAAGLKPKTEKEAA